MTKTHLAEIIARSIKDEGVAKLPAMDVFNIFEPTLESSSQFTDELVNFSQRHDWLVYPIGEVPFGELVFYSKGKIFP